MIGGRTRKLLLAIVAILVFAATSLVSLFLSALLIGQFVPIVRDFVGGLTLATMLALGPCDTLILTHRSMLNSSWSVDVKVRHCSALDDAPYEIVATNAATGRTYRVANILEYSSPNLVSFDATGRLVITVPHGAAVHDRRDTVGDLRVVYRYDP
ncbi:MAG TPA: hypothetical protein VMF53_01115 [Alphaproteobacteria bacterium]|nr:hypothetical protein [Alphaproteobacteria bacterium]